VVEGERAAENRHGFGCYLPPFRVCRKCGYAEEYTLYASAARFDFRVSVRLISRDEARTFVRDRVLTQEALAELSRAQDFAAEKTRKEAAEAETSSALSPGPEPYDRCA
jgi:hypothetical protein